MRVFFFAVLVIIVASSPSNAEVKRVRQLQDDTVAPTSTPVLGGDEVTMAPTPADSESSTEVSSAFDTASGTEAFGDGEGNGAGDSDGDGNGDMDIPTPAPFDGFGTPAPVDSLSPAPVSGMSGGGDDTMSSPPTDATSEDETPSPAPAVIQPTYPTYAPAFPTEPLPWPTEPPILYIAPDDDHVSDLNGEASEWNSETIEEMEHDKNVLIALSVVGAVGLCLALITAQQLLENPEGCCASICRMFVACLCGITRCVCYPCRAICGCTGRDRRNHDLISAGDNNYTHDLELS